MAALRGGEAADGGARGERDGAVAWVATFTLILQKKRRERGKPREGRSSTEKTKAAFQIIEGEELRDCWEENQRFADFWKREDQKTKKKS